MYYKKYEFKKELIQLYKVKFFSFAHSVVTKSFWEASHNVTYEIILSLFHGIVMSDPQKIH